jgi:hypothetical protein
MPVLYARLCYSLYTLDIVPISSILELISNCKRIALRSVDCTVKYHQQTFNLNSFAIEYRFDWEN